jgi:tRNA-2-methylthio-N6-dimethylallyladenosine synthase
MIDAMARLDTVCEHFHLPVQSGDDAVLRRMKRTYTTGRYYEIIDQLRERIPDVAVTTDAIVGFPGETDEQFESTLRLFDRVQFDQAFMFAYSPRRFTEAMDFPDQIPEATQKRRLHELIALQNANSTRKNAGLVGREFEVLVEGPSEKNPNKLCGRTRTNKLMMFAGECRPGQLVTVRADAAFLWGFQGTLVRWEKPAVGEPDLIPLSAI